MTWGTAANGGSADSRLRIGGWVRGPAHVPDGAAGDAMPGDAMPGDVPAGDAPAYGAHTGDVQNDGRPLGTGEWSSDSDPLSGRGGPFGADRWFGDAGESSLDAPAPAPEAGTENDAGAYRGRRRLVVPARWGAPWRRKRIAAAAVLAVGALLLGTGVLATLLRTDPVTPPAPPPTPAHEAGQGPGGGTDRRGQAPTASPVSSPVSTPEATKEPTPPPVRTRSYEAEAAEPGSHGQTVSMDGASGGQVVRLSGNSDGTFVRFPDVRVDESGRYELTVFYFCEQTRTGTISVNDESHTSVTFPARGEDGIGSVAATVDLAAGANVIWIGTPGGAPLSLDRITVDG